MDDLLRSKPVKNLLSGFTEKHWPRVIRSVLTIGINYLEAEALIGNITPDELEALARSTSKKAAPWQRKIVLPGSGLSAVNLETELPRGDDVFDAQADPLCSKSERGREDYKPLVSAGPAVRNVQTSGSSQQGVYPDWWVSMGEQLPPPLPNPQHLKSQNTRPEPEHDQTPKAVHFDEDAHDYDSINAGQFGHQEDEADLEQVHANKKKERESSSFFVDLTGLAGASTQAPPVRTKGKSSSKAKPQARLQSRPKTAPARHQEQQASKKKAKAKKKKNSNKENTVVRALMSHQQQQSSLRGADGYNSYEARKQRVGSRKQIAKPTQNSGGRMSTRAPTNYRKVQSKLKTILDIDKRRYAGKMKDISASRAACKQQRQEHKLLQQFRQQQQQQQQHTKIPDDSPLLPPVRLGSAKARNVEPGPFAPASRNPMSMEEHGSTAGYIEHMHHHVYVLRKRHEHIKSEYFDTSVQNDKLHALVDETCKKFDAAKHELHKVTTALESTYAEYDAYKERTTQAMRDQARQYEQSGAVKLGEEISELRLQLAKHYGEFVVQAHSVVCQTEPVQVSSVQKTAADGQLEPIDPDLLCFDKKLLPDSTQKIFADLLAPVKEFLKKEGKEVEEEEPEPSIEELKEQLTNCNMQLDGMKDQLDAFKTTNSKLMQERHQLVGANEKLQSQLRQARNGGVDPVVIKVDSQALEAPDAINFKRRSVEDMKENLTTSFSDKAWPGPKREQFVIALLSAVGLGGDLLLGSDVDDRKVMRHDKHSTLLMRINALLHCTLAKGFCLDAVETLKSQSNRSKGSDGKSHNHPKTNHNPTVFDEEEEEEEEDDEFGSFSAGGRRASTKSSKSSKSSKRASSEGTGKSTRTQRQRASEAKVSPYFASSGSGSNRKLLQELSSDEEDIICSRVPPASTSSAGVGRAAAVVVESVSSSEEEVGSFTQLQAEAEETAAGDNVLDTEKEELLCEYLTDAREEIRAALEKAQGQKVSAFSIVGHNTIFNIARGVPQTIKELGDIAGFGHRRARMHGSVFLKAIDTFLRSQGMPSRVDLSVLAPSKDPISSSSPSTQRFNATNNYFCSPGSQSNPGYKVTVFNPPNSKRRSPQLEHPLHNHQQPPFKVQKHSNHASRPPQNNRFDEFDEDLLLACDQIDMGQYE